MTLLATRPCWQCGHCSTLVCPEPVADGVRLTGNAGNTCPICRQALARAVMDDREPIQVCQRCKGIFMSREAFAATLVARRRAAERPSVIPRPADRSDLERRIACPQCGSEMLTDWYYGPGNIVIDTCTDCDVVWLDAGELGRAIDAPGRDRRP
jgi:Zn-finger nucleic acid-binding protein